VYWIYLLQNMFPYNILGFVYESTNWATADETSGQTTDYKFVKNAFICVVELQGRLYVELNTIIIRLQDGTITIVQKFLL